MLIAIPVRNERLSGHFSKAESIALLDTGQHSTTMIDLTDHAQGCQRKKQWKQLIESKQVDMVLVRNIGKKMLQSLFDLGVEVRAAKSTQTVSELNIEQLERVNDISYGRDKPAKKMSCCSSSLPPRNKLSPSTVRNIRMRLTKIE